MTHKGTVTFETERLILRRFELEDAEAMFRNWASDAEVVKYLTWPAHSDISVSKTVIDSWLKLYENLNHYSWAIVLKDIGEPIGSIAAVEQRDDIQMVHIGYCIGRKWWRQDYTSEALAELMRFFFEDVGVNRIESRHDPRNPNSGKVMMKCGLQYEGTLWQSDINYQGGFCDAAYYAILAEDYRKAVLKPSIEDHVLEVLGGDTQEDALDFARFLRENSMQFERGAGYWADKRYWMIKYNNQYVCFILINGYGSVRHKDEPEGWIVWSDASDSSDSQWYENAPLDERIKEAAWQNVDFCGNCNPVNPCYRGMRKIIFDKEFNHVCRTTFRFDNPDAEALKCMKNLVEIRKIDCMKNLSHKVCCSEVQHR